MTIINNNRFEILDCWRGFAMVLMIIFHFCYDLSYFGYIEIQITQGFWRAFRYLIVIQFLLLVGISLQLAHQSSINWNSMRNRSLYLAFSCFLVTLSGFFIAPDMIIIFGILQLILVSSWFALVFLKYPKIALILSLPIFIAGHYISFNIFNSSWLYWIGFTTYRPRTFDYAPLFPWFGVVLLGIYLGSRILASKTLQQKLSLSKKQPSKSKFINKIIQILSWFGRHSLLVYMVHQPLLFVPFLFIEYFIK